MCVCVCRPINPFLRKGLITFKGESVTRRRLTDNSRKRDRHVESPRHTIIHHHRHLPTSAANSITRNNATVNLHTLRLYHTSNKASQVWLRTQGREGAEKNNRSAAAVCGRWEIIFSAELLLPHKGCMCVRVCVSCVNRTDLRNNASDTMKKRRNLSRSLLNTAANDSPAKSR